MLSMKSLFVAVLAVYVSYKVYNLPVPKGTSEPNKLRLALLMRDIEFGIIDYLDFLGFVSDYKVIRWRRQVSVQATDGVQREDVVFDGVHVRVYRPNNSSISKAMVYYHGGGWVLGSVDAYDSVTSYFARHAAMLVVSVEYRLVPEHSKNDGLEDCLRATKYFLSNSARYGVNPDRVLIAGDSAGGNYAAAVALRLRDDGFRPMPAIQLLIYPAVQAIDLDLPSHQQNADGPFLTKSLMAWFLSFVCCHSKRLAPIFLRNGHVPSDVRASMAEGVLNHDLLPNENKYPPYKKPDYGGSGSEIWSRIRDHFRDGYYFPLMADNHGRLPKAYVITAQYDVLRDDGYLYAEKLRQDGCDVTHYNCPYCWHGIISGLGNFKDATRITDTLVAYINDNL